MSNARQQELLQEYYELLNCAGKLSKTDKILIMQEIDRLNNINKNNNETDIQYIKNNIRRIRRRYMYKDKAKRGRTYFRASKKYYKKVANRKCRRAKDIPFKGCGYKKVFDLAWNLV